jgi:hypothetical protein
MPIEEKAQLLEFNCTLEGMPDIVWNIKYDPNSKIGLQVSGNGQEFHCPVELFGDVADFLQNKQILKPNNVLTRSATVPTRIPGIREGSFAAGLLPPQIDGQVDTAAPINAAPMDALSSFDITEGQEVDAPTERANENVGVEVGNKVITSDTKTNIIDRPVIRTRVTQADPTSAERDAAAIRGSDTAGGKKIIKKRHESE